MTSPVYNPTYMQIYRGRHCWPLDDRRYRIIAPLYARAPCGGDDMMSVEVEPGYSWDGPTMLPVWRWERNLMLWASIFHDAPYKDPDGRPHQQGKFKIYINGRKVETWTREQADEFFRNLLRDNGASFIWAWIVNLFVRTFGQEFHSDVG